MEIEKMLGLKRLLNQYANSKQNEIDTEREKEIPIYGKTVILEGQKDIIWEIIKLVNKDIASVSY